MKKTLFLALIALFTLSLQAQKAVYPLPLDSGKTITGNTLCYMLPTTALKVTVNVSKVREIKGHYADYAENLLGLSHIITENKTYYKLNDIQIEPVRVPDTHHAYLVVLSNQQISNGALTRTSEKENFLPGFSQESVHYTCTNAPIPDFFKNYSDPSFTEMEDSFVETKIIDGIVTQVPANHTKLVSRSHTQKAQEAADAISKCRKDQYNLAAGEQEVEYSVETLERMLNELKDWEENYLSLFTGLVLESQQEYTFYVVPEELNKIDLFAFDPNQGLTTHNLQSGNAINYSLTFTPAFQTNSVENAIVKSKKVDKNNGYRFRTAMPMNVTLQHGQTEIEHFGIIDMLQGGRIQTLPKSQNNLDIQSIGFVF